MVSLKRYGDTRIVTCDEEGKPDFDSDESIEKEIDVKYVQERLNKQW